MSNTSFRYDVAPIERYELTPEGYLRLHATIARTGVQHYSNGDGSIRREYRAPEDVALPESLASFAGKSVTDEHPLFSLIVPTPKTIKRASLALRLFMTMALSGQS